MPGSSSKEGGGADGKGNSAAHDGIREPCDAASVKGPRQRHKGRKPANVRSLDDVEAADGDGKQTGRVPTKAHLSRFYPIEIPVHSIPSI